MIFKKKEIPTVLPKHISFIIDGNGRWAKKRGMPRTVGHKFGLDAVKKVVDCIEEFMTNSPWHTPFLCPTTVTVYNKTYMFW